MKQFIFLEEPNAAFEELNEIEYMYVLEEESKEYIDKIEVVDEMSITLSIKKTPLRMKLRLKSRLKTIKAH